VNTTFLLERKSTPPFRAPQILLFEVEVGEKMLKVSPFSLFLFIFCFRDKGLPGFCLPVEIDGKSGRENAKTACEAHVMG